MGIQKIIVCLIICLFSSSLIDTAGAAIFCVKTVDEFQSALTTAAHNQENDEIHIQQGTYIGNFACRVYENNSLIIKGGYTDSCTEREVDPDNTILDAYLNGCVLYLDSTYEADFTVDGLTLKNGEQGLCVSTNGDTVTLTNNTISGITSERAVGVYARSGDTVTLTNNTISGITGENAVGVSTDACDTTTLTNNTISGISSGSAGSGGVHVCDSDTTTLTNNTISNNSAGLSGGGVIAYGGVDTIITLTNNTISNNSAGWGGGVHTYGLAGPTIITLTNNTISGNNSTEGPGGGVYGSAVHATFTNNTISGNYAEGSGGGVYGSHSSATFTNNTISGNYAKDSGGGYYATAASATFTNNTISGNYAEGSGGGVFSFRASAITLTNNTISGNSAVDSGGGVYVDGAEDTLTLTNNTISNNSAESGGGFYISHNNESNIYNNIIWGNTAYSGADLYIINGDYTVNLFYNDFDQGINGTYITDPFPFDSSNLNNIDPLFVNTYNNNFHLTDNSPCINAGYNNAPNLPETDSDGEPRIMDGTVDIGADEYSSVIASEIIIDLIPPSDTTISKGNLLGPFYSSVTNNSTNSSYSLYICPYIGTPDGNWIKLYTRLITLEAGETIWANDGNDIYMKIPNIAKTGTFYLCVNAYDMSYNLIDQDCFSFEVTAAQSSSDQTIESNQRLKSLLNTPDVQVYEKDGWETIIVNGGDIEKSQ